MVRVGQPTLLCYGTVWMNLSSLIPVWLSDFHTVRFSDSSGCFLCLNCFFLLGIVRGSKAYLPTPSWLKVLNFVNKTIHSLHFVIYALYNILSFASWPVKPKIFTIWFFTEKVCQPYIPSPNATIILMIINTLSRI